MANYDSDRVYFSEDSNEEDEDMTHEVWRRTEETHRGNRVTKLESSHETRAEVNEALRELIDDEEVEFEVSKNKDGYIHAVGIMVSKLGKLEIEKKIELWSEISLKMDCVQRGLQNVEDEAGIWVVMEKGKIAGRFRSQMEAEGQIQIKIARVKMVFEGRILRKQDFDVKQEKFDDELERYVDTSFYGPSRQKKRWP